MATMKSNNAAIAAMQQMLQERCIAEPTFAIRMANPNKSMEGAINYLCSQIQKIGLCCVDDTTVMNILVHYFDENEIEEGGKVNCNIVVSKPELSDEDKAELKEQAMEQYKNTRRSNSGNSADNHSRRLNPSRPPPLPKPEQRLTQSPICLMNSKHPQDYETEK